MTATERHRTQIGTELEWLLRSAVELEVVARRLGADRGQESDTGRAELTAAADRMKRSVIRRLRARSGAAEETETR
jgi:hypothetical protein